MESHGLPDHLITNIRLAIPLKAWLLKHGVEDVMKQVDDLSNHGAKGGVPGFIYTRDLIDFIKQDGVLATIRDMIEDRAEGFGDSMFTLAYNIVRCKHHSKFETERLAAMMLVSPVDDITNDDYLLAQVVWWGIEQSAYEMADVQIEGSNDE